MNVQVIHGDCLEVMPSLPDVSVDMVLADLPYGTTRNPWDSVLPLDALWASYKRVLRPNGVVVLTASQPFTGILVTSNLPWFRHEWIWRKNRGSNFANTVREPMKEHESVLVFSPGKWTYHKQMERRAESGLSRVQYRYNDASQESSNYNAFNGAHPEILPDERIPSSVQRFICEVGLHPTQKPVALFRYLIRTYTNPGDLILDNVAGSGTTGMAAIREGRRAILIEKDAHYCEVARKRVSDAAAHVPLPFDEVSA